MKVYDFPASPNCRKVRAVAYELGLNPQFVRVQLFSGGTKQPDFVAKNPNARVPVLEDEDFVLWESNAIMSYLAAKYARPAASLLPSNLRERADVDRWLHWQLAHLGPAISKVAVERVVKPLIGGTLDPAAVELGITEFKKYGAVFEGALASRKTEFIAGALSVADFALASYYSLAGPAGLDLSPFPKTIAWLERMTTRESMKRALEEAKAAIGEMAAARAEVRA